MVWGRQALQTGRPKIGLGPRDEGQVSAPHPSLVPGFKPDENAIGPGQSYFRTLLSDFRTLLSDSARYFRISARYFRVSARYFRIPHVTFAFPSVTFGFPPITFGTSESRLSSTFGSESRYASDIPDSN